MKNTIMLIFLVCVVFCNVAIAQILIQKTGNSINGYTRLSECDRKYIRLVRLKK